jgi:hypothetical protein
MQRTTSPSSNGKLPKRRQLRKHPKTKKHPPHATQPTNLPTRTNSNRFPNCQGTNPNAARRKPCYAASASVSGNIENDSWNCSGY